MDVITKAIDLLKQYPLCDYCLGRQFSILGHGLTNEERGRTIKQFLVLEANRLLLEEDVEGTEILQMIGLHGFSHLSFRTMKNLGITIMNEKKSCYLCGGAFENLDDLYRMIVDKLANFEFSTFLIGIKIDAQIEEKEDELRSRAKLKWGESMRSDFSREIGRRISKSTRKEISFERPDIVVIVDPFRKELSFQVNSFCIYGRYRKLIRGIPQAKWLCSNCLGQGCKYCKWKGKLYPDSVEELISKPLLQASKGTDVKIHAAGREDIDVLVLGSGRPFIIEILDPLKRSLDLEKLEMKINETSQGKIEVEGLVFTSKRSIKKLKAMSRANKVYRALIEFEKEISEETLSQLEERLKNMIIQQKTPSRVLHRRADKLRKKRLLSIVTQKKNANIVEMTLRVEGGFYIKEFISGDEGRTTPSITEVCEIAAKCLELDVLKINMEGFI
jgi:tRNA pseudouridine synthase 10